MARTINADEYNARRNEILDLALQQIYTCGYEQMSIKDIRSKLDMSNGAFYHYFQSRQAVLEALIERIQSASEQRELLPIIQNQKLTALEKFERFMATLDQSRATHKGFVTELLRVWFSDENALVREKIYQGTMQRRAPLLMAIIRQGVDEGVFNTPYPDHVSSVVLFITRGMSEALARAMLTFSECTDDLQTVDDIVSTYAAYVDALERVLGASLPFLHRPDANTIRQWLDVDKNLRHVTRS